jgi:diguanylate cyclase (GGDEF)-like protein
MHASCDSCAADELLMREITEKMVRQYAPAAILRLLCRYAAPPGAAWQLAFFLTDGQTWTFSTKGDLDRASETALARIDPAWLSHTIFETGARAYRFEGGWARHLYSGAGELLGMITGFGSESPPLLNSSLDNRIEVVLQLAALSIDQANLTAERMFKGAEAAAPEAPGVSGETCEQEVVRMIAQQCTPAEILSVLCKHVGALDTERQVAFFLIQGGTWTLMAKGPLDAPAEATLSRLDPEALSAEILTGLAEDAAGHRESTFKEGWARHLFSGTGELLGLMVGLRGVPARPCGRYASRVELACRLAVLAVEQTNLIEELSFKADHDALTGLPSRGYYERMLRSTLREGGRTHSRAALLYIDLDRFGVVNEVFGLAIGNGLLQEAANRFQAALRRGTFLARMDGDEFAVIVPAITGSEDAGGVATRLLHSLANPFLIEGHEIFVNASIGIGCSSAKSTAETLEREAYLALDEAKRTGKGRAVHFHVALAAISPERLQMEKRLRSALARQEFALYYQPQIQLATGRVSGAEALLRWRPDGLGLVSPAVFIPILEETGLIVDVGRWVLREACRQGNQWLAQGLPLRIGVNVSALQLLHGDFLGHVEEALVESGFPAKWLELELTESMLVGDFATASGMLANLQAMGIGLALDDFGTGQSSLSYLNRLPFHRMKIDQSFIRPIVDGQVCPPIVHNVVQMAASLGMEVVAEGIETAYQAELLKREACETGQGFLFSRPLTASDAENFCRSEVAILV